MKWLYKQQPHLDAQSCSCFSRDWYTIHMDTYKKRRHTISFSESRVFIFFRPHLYFMQSTVLVVSLHIIITKAHGSLLTKKCAYQESKQKNQLLSWVLSAYSHFVPKVTTLCFQKAITCVFEFSFSFYILIKKKKGNHLGARLSVSAQDESKHEPNDDWLIYINRQHLVEN